MLPPTAILAIAWEVTLRCVVRSLLPSRLEEAEAAERRLGEIIERLRQRESQVIALPTGAQSRPRRPSSPPAGQLEWLRDLETTAALKLTLLPLRESKDPLSALDVSSYAWADDTVRRLLSGELKARIDAPSRTSLRVLRQLHSVAGEFVSSDSDKWLTAYAHSHSGLLEIHADPIYDQELDDALHTLDQAPRSHQWRDKLQVLGTWDALRDLVAGLPDLETRFGPDVEALRNAVATPWESPRDLLGKSGGSPEPPTLSVAQQAPSSVTPGHSRGEGQELSVETRALQMLLAHPDWNNIQIAKAVGTSPNYLSQLKKFRAARRQMRSTSVPRGSKAGDGTLEAWDDEADED